jgi:hypothetical protein
MRSGDDGCHGDQHLKSRVNDDGHKPSGVCLVSALLCQCCATDIGKHRRACLLYKVIQRESDEGVDVPGRLTSFSRNLSKFGT